MIRKGIGVASAEEFASKGMARSCEVLIVGAGPIGMTIANLLGTHGIYAMIVERAASLSDVPRAVAIDDEGMRTLQMAGLVEAASPHMLLGYDHHLFGRNGQLLLRVDPAGREHGFAKRNRFHQPILERCLLDGLSRFPVVSLHFGRALVNYDVDDEGVEVVVEGPAGPLRVRAQYLVGADGGGSIVRRLAGIDMEGESHPEPWIVIDTEDNDDTARYSRAIGDPRRPAVNVPGVNGRRRYEFMLLPGEDPVEAVSDAAIARLMAPHCDLSRVKITRRAVYNFHSLLAARFIDRGRVFLAGDAAHMMPPFQGQGMNSGMRDAAMLAWRLAAVLRGTLPPGILASYETERRPHAGEMIRLSQQVGRILMTRNRLRAFARDTMFRFLGKLPVTGRYLREMRFKPKPVAAEGFFLAQDNGVAGKLFPQPDVLDASGRRVPLDTVLGSGFSLLHITDAPGAHRAAFTHPFWTSVSPTHVTVVPGGLAPKNDGDGATVSDIGGLVRAAAGERSGISLLLRPDRYVAAVIGPGDSSQVAEQLAALVAR